MWGLNGGLVDIDGFYGHPGAPYSYTFKFPQCQMGL